ncbi:MAG: precorrin-3B C(17)-methyltransferase [Oscillospiraceae bacterium]|nr:precorrin-3B C(17)-methyltransferase [Oscillospiraceae bacterium]
MNMIYVVGIGPGKESAMTAEARQAMDSSDVIIGYSKYVELVKPYYSEKEFLDTGMRKETDRCRMAFEQADAGKTVALVCSGDAGIYGMAGLIYELSPSWPDTEIVVVPGITAAISGGASLGAPIGHDFAVISLSDLLTPWDLIEKRLKYAAMGDFNIALYNPSSHKRHDYLQKACDILLTVHSGDLICGYVQNIGREGERAVVLTLSKLRDTQVDMFTTVFIGSTRTRVINGKMVTPRGYRDV